MSVTILIAEDEPGWRETFKDYLEDMGYNVLLATTGRELEELACRADILLVDIQMPFEDGEPPADDCGVEVVHRLQEENPSDPSYRRVIFRSMFSPDYATAATPTQERMADRVECIAWLERGVGLPVLMKAINDAKAQLR